MAKFLNTSAVTYHLEELIKNSHERLVLISPFLKFNDRMRELLEDRDRLKIDIRIVYGKNELQPHENNWLKGLAFVRTSFCKNLHAKCYLNESHAIITSMNLYEFSQVNNNEMGVLVERETDGALYQETYQEAQRLIRISEELKVTVERVNSEESEAATAPTQAATASGSTTTVREQPGDTEPKQDHPSGDNGRKVSTSQLAKSRGIKSRDLFAQFQDRGFIIREGDNWKLTPEGEKAGGEMRKSRQYGEYIVWPEKVG